jgi:hypothetical protein
MLPYLSPLLLLLLPMLLLQCLLQLPGSVSAAPARIRQQRGHNRRQVIDDSSSDRDEIKVSEAAKRRRRSSSVEADRSKDTASSSNTSTSSDSKYDNIAFVSEHEAKHTGIQFKQPQIVDDFRTSSFGTVTSIRINDYDSHHELVQSFCMKRARNKKRNKKCTWED